MKNIIFWAISQHEKWMLCYNERYPLLLGCFISLLIWIRKLTGASASIYKPLMVHIMSFLPRSFLKLRTKKCKILGTLSAQEVRCCIARSDIHCYGSSSWPSLDSLGCWEELLTDSMSTPWFILCHISKDWVTNCIQNTRFLVPSKHRKLDTVLQGTMSIAAEVCQNLPQMHTTDTG